MRDPPPNCSFTVFTDLLCSRILISPGSLFGVGGGEVGGLGTANLEVLVAQLLDPVDQLLALEVPNLAPAAGATIRS